MRVQLDLYMFLVCPHRASTTTSYLFRMSLSKCLGEGPMIFASLRSNSPFKRTSGPCDGGAEALMSKPHQK
jgi:hypothetical protein